MSADLLYLVYSALLSWLMVMTAATFRARAWTPRGLWVALGNRDDVPEPSALAARAERAAKNMIENLVLFAALLLAVHVGGVASERLVTGARVFFWARVLYFPVYLAGIKVLRTLVWAVSIAGMAMIAAAAF